MKILIKLFDTPFPWIPAGKAMIFFYILQPSFWQGLGFAAVISSFAFWGWVRNASK